MTDDLVTLLRSHATDLNIEIERLRRERDDARREVCEPIAIATGHRASTVAAWRGWDCYARQVPDKSTP